jgi:hypothetical protein
MTGTVTSVGDLSTATWHLADFGLQLLTNAVTRHRFLKELWTSGFVTRPKFRFLKNGAFRPDQAAALSKKLYSLLICSLPLRPFSPPWNGY